MDRDREEWSLDHLLARLPREQQAKPPPAFWERYGGKQVGLPVLNFVGDLHVVEPATPFDYTPQAQLVALYLYALKGTYIDTEFYVEPKVVTSDRYRRLPGNQQDDNKLQADIRAAFMTSSP